MRVVIEHGKLLDATSCSRCGESLDIRTVSHFTGEPIGRKCMQAEAELKEQMLNAGLCVEDYRNCGYMPNPKKGFKK